MHDLLYSPPTRHVILPKHVAATVPKGRLMSEAEWRKLGVQQSRGWVHYMVHKPGEGMCLIMQSYKPFGYMYINPVTGFPPHRATCLALPKAQTSSQQVPVTRLPMSIISETVRTSYDEILHK